MDYRISRAHYKVKLKQQDIDLICENTGFTEEKVIEWYEHFIEQCPDGKLNKEEFISFYSSLIPGESSEEEEFCSLIFDVYDVDNDGEINFGKLLHTFEIINNIET